MDFCTFPLFLGAAERESSCGLLSGKQILMVTAVAMILRVWAIYNRSMLILRTLLLLLSLTIIFAILTTVIDDKPGNQPGV